jgi:hypothetical protein
MHRLFKPIVAVLCLVFALCFLAPNAHADSIIEGTLNFTVLSGGPTPTGSFIFDITVNYFTSFTVDWNGGVFDYAAVFNSLGLPVAVQGASWCAAAQDKFFYPCAPVGATFILNGQFRTPNVASFIDPFAGANGTYTVTETLVPAPEPSSLALMLAGVGLVFAMRRRETLPFAFNRRH